MKRPLRCKNSILNPNARVLYDEELFYFIFDSYDELVSEHQVAYVAGGAAQNAARGAAVRISS